MSSPGEGLRHTNDQDVSSDSFQSSEAIKKFVGGVAAQGVTGVTMDVCGAGTPRRGSFLWAEGCVY